MSKEEADQVFTGLGRRRPRLTDAQTAEAMLETALRELTRTGLTVGLDHIRLEDIIREAGVARSAVYRRWPHKDQFLGDLLLELARSATPRHSPSLTAAIDLIRATLLDRLDELRDPARRLQIAVEVLRDTAETDFQHVYRSSQWRTYLALTVTFISLPPGPLHDKVAEALATTEAGFTAGITAGYRLISDLLGLRLRHESVDFEVIAQLVNGMMRGLVVKALAAPELAERHIVGDLFGVDGEWSLPALGLSGIVTSFLEPDGEWDDAQLLSLRKLLETGNPYFKD